jgi:geranylgeranyl pyrophosphate synthase
MSLSEDNFTLLWKSYLTSLSRVEPEFEEELIYLSDWGGKHLRPRLFLAAVKDISGPLDAARDIGLSLELIHQSSLIHDDLPALDNDDFRRGKLTFHKKFGAGRAVLFGNFIAVKAFEHLIEIELPATLKITVLKNLLQIHSTIQKGQALDLALGNDPLEVCKKKTAIFFELILKLVANFGSFEKEIIQAFADFGQALGVLFQLADDYRDFAQDQKRSTPSNSFFKLPPKRLDEIKQFWTQKLKENFSLVHAKCNLENLKSFLSSEIDLSCIQLELAKLLEN